MRGELWLEGCLGFEHRLAISKGDSRWRWGIQVKPPWLGRVRAMPHLCVLYPGICLTTEGRSTEKTSFRVVEKCQWAWFNVSTWLPFGVAMTSCQSRFPCFRGPGSTLGQPRHLSSCIAKGFTTSANFESNPLRSDVVGKCGCEFACYLCTKVHW